MRVRPLRRDHVSVDSNVEVFNHIRVDLLIGRHEPVDE